MISREDIDAVRNAADLASLARERGIELRSVGTRLVGLCPVHNEKTGSFNVNAATNTFVCFGCGFKGDVFAFVSEVDGLPFVDVVRSLAERYGIVIHEDASSEDVAAASIRKRALAAAEMAAAWYRENFHALPDVHPAREELRKRNLYVVEGRPTWLEDFGIGYAREGWSHLSDYLLSKKFTANEIVSAGLATESEKTGRLVDRFRGRLTWEIRDIQGRVLGFGARKLFDTDDGPKYLNSPQSVIYDKSRVIFGLDLARKSIISEKRVHIVEGYTDVMANAAAGITNVVASSGTAFGEEHVAIIRRLIDDFEGKVQGEFVFAFDSDKAGQEAARRTFALKSNIHTRSYVASSGDGAKDACDLRKDEGDEALRAAMSHKISLTDFVLKEEIKAHDISTAEGRSNFIRIAASMLSVIEDSILREDYARRVAFMSGANFDAVATAIRKAPRFDPSEQKVVQRNYLDESTSEVVEQPRSGMWDQEIMVLSMLVQYPEETMQAVKEYDLTESDFVDTVLRTIFTEATLALEAGVKLMPSDFTHSEQAILLFHTRLAMIEKFLSTNRAQELLSRTAHRFVRSLKEAHVAVARRNLSARVEQSFSDRSTEDVQALQEILNEQKQVRRVRRNNSSAPSLK